jgi:PHD/YefM family antitoxin component YafN of YafNO toxin-antitoxin module
VKRVQSGEAAEKFDEWLDDSQAEPIIVQHAGRDAVVFLSPEEYKRLLAELDRQP